MSSEQSPISARLHPCFQLVHMSFKHLFVRAYDLLYGFSFSRTFSAFCRTTRPPSLVGAWSEFSSTFRQSSTTHQTTMSSRLLDSHGDKLAGQYRKEKMNIKGTHFCYNRARGRAPPKDSGRAWRSLREKFLHAFFQHRETVQP